MDLDDEELNATKMAESRKEKKLKWLKTEIEEGNYCITIYGSDTQLINEIITENEEIKNKLNKLDDKIKRLENIIDYDRPYEWEKEIYCVEVLKQIKRG